MQNDRTLDQLLFCTVNFGHAKQDILLSVAENLLKIKHQRKVKRRIQTHKMREQDSSSFLFLNKR